jgi:hypothetical protein
MDTIEAGDIVVFKDTVLLTVLEIQGHRALCSFQAADKLYKGNQRPEYLRRYEDLFPLSELKVVKKASR